MKARIPKHREFIISIDEKEEPRHQECWEKLNQIVKDYQKQGKSVYTETFIEDNEEKVKELQKSISSAIPSKSADFFQKRGEPHRQNRCGSFLRRKAKITV